MVVEEYWCVVPGRSTPPNFRYLFAPNLDPWVCGQSSRLANVRSSFGGANVLRGQRASDFVDQGSLNVPCTVGVQDVSPR